MACSSIITFALICSRWQQADCPLHFEAVTRLFNTKRRRHMNIPVTKKPRRYIKDFTPGEFVDEQVFLINSKDLRTSSNGSLYIHCVLRDKSGQLLARVWQATEPMFEQMPEGGFLRFKGRVENYKGALQFIIDAMRPCEPAAVDLSDFMPQTSEDIPKMFERVKEILRQIKNKHLLILVKQ